MMSQIARFTLFAALLCNTVMAYAVNTNPQFEFGTIAADKCTTSGPSVECVIDFENSYSEPPLVFVMATVNANRSNFDTKTTEYPSDLRVWSVSSAQATIKQLLPPNDAACVRLRQNNNGQWRCSTSTNDPLVNYVDAPMENIDYLVIEPGVLEFSSSAKLVAGLAEHNRTFSNAGGTSNVSKQINFSDYGLSDDFSDSPGVLVQIQSMNNMENSQPLWLTPIALNPDEEKFNLVLDRSEVSVNAQLEEPEQVAFVAGLGEGFVNGRKFWLGQGQTDNTLNIDDRVIKPISEGCLFESEFEASGFSSIPTLLASKRTRNGNNGGWLRRCSVSRSGVALINEEDMTKDFERAHVVEPYSYFLFDKPPTSEVCELFPSPAQTWKENSNGFLNMKNNALISGAPLSNGKRYVGFFQSDISLGNDASCDQTDCFGDEGLMVDRLELESFKTSSEEIVIDSDEEETFRDDEILKKLEVKNNGKATFESGTYWIEDLKVDNSAFIEIPDGEKVQIHVKKMELKNNAKFYTLGNAELTVVVHGTNKTTFDNSAELTGLIYSEGEVELKNNAKVYGAVTARAISLDNSAQIIATDNHCFQPSDDYNVSITPATDLALICGSEQPEFTITTTNNGTATSLGVSVSLSPTSSDGDFSLDVIEGIGTGSDGSFTSNSEGLLKLGISVEKPENISLEQTYNINVVMVDDGSKSASAQYQFVPFKFDAPNVDIFAGENGEVPISVKGCDESDEINVLTYTGAPEIKYSIETAGSLEPWELDFQPKFELGDDGDNIESIKILETGQFDIELEDSEFDCSGLDNCPIDGIGILQGSFTLRSAPWKIAICNVISENGDSNPGKTDQVGGGFVSAGTPFSVNYRPIQHPDSNSGDECSYNITTNYAKDSGPYQLDTALSYPDPDDGTLGDFEPLVSYSFSPNDEGGIKQVTYMWNEVGTLGFTTSGEYLGININKDDLDIGRFYPAHLALLTHSQQTWEYPDKQDSFAYMSQPIAHNFIVEAQNTSSEPVENYGYFDGSLISNIDYFALDDNDIEFGDVRVNGYSELKWEGKTDEQGNTDWQGAQLDVTIDDFKFKRKLDPDSSDTTLADGPVTEKFGLRVSDVVDDVNFPSDELDMENSQKDKTGISFIEQPDFRYGRMVMSDVGGTLNADIPIPLRIEYWDGSWKVNTDDDASEFISESTYLCFQDNSSGATLNGSDLAKTVEAGNKPTTTDLTAINNGTAESVRVWMKMNSSTPDKVDSNDGDISCATGDLAQPWLMYDWRGQGDEHPSSLITFGVYRGNDRIIFRGEPGLTGQ